LFEYCIQNPIDGQDPRPGTGGGMRAAVLHGFGDLRIEEVPDPLPGPHDVVLDVACVQLSVTECMLIAGEPVALHHQLAAALATGPVRFGGHEFAGVVRAVGSAARDVAIHDIEVGAQVTAVETIDCGSCGPCRRGRPDACLAPEFIGFTRRARSPNRWWFRPRPWCRCRLASPPPRPRRFSHSPGRCTRTPPPPCDPAKPC